MFKVVRAKTLYDDNVKYYRVDGIEDIQCGDYFLGETCFGEDLVQIACNKQVEISKEQWQSMIKSSTKKSHFSFEPKLIRKAQAIEINDSCSHIELAHTHRDVFEQKIKEYNIDLKIVKLHYTLAKDRLICIYIAPSRVDFRAFVKDLGHILKQRIELFQIPSQGAVLLINTNDLGVCGRQVCCATFCKQKTTNCKIEYTSKSAKTLGCCGKPRCCLIFEE